MMNNTKIGMLACGMLVAALSCDSGRRDLSAEPNPQLSGASEGQPSLQYESTRRPPATLEIRGPAQVLPNSLVDLAIVVTRQGSRADPIALSLKLPAGATLVSGALTETLTDPGVAPLTRKITLQLQEIPTDDLVVEIDGRSLTSGFHATKTWGFGRSAKKLASPATAEEPIVIRGRNFGKLVKLAP